MDHFNSPPVVSAHYSCLSSTGKKLEYFITEFLGGHSGTSNVFNLERMLR